MIRAALVTLTLLASPAAVADDWATPAEAAKFQTTPTYAETHPFSSASPRPHPRAST